MKVIGISGMPGSGKGVISNMAKDIGFVIIRMGDVVRDEAKARGEDVGKTAVDLRKEHGRYVVAIKCVEKIEKDYAENKYKHPNRIYMIEGIRSPHEVNIFNKKFKKITVISAFSNPKTRFRRLKKRNRSDDSKSFREFKKRDTRELNFGIGNVIALSDHIIVNEGPIWRYKKQIKKVLTQIKESKPNNYRRRRV